MTTILKNPVIFAVPHSQIKSLYAGMDVDGEKKSAKEKKNSDKKGKKQEKKVEPPKPKIPKTIEGALEAVSCLPLLILVYKTTSIRTIYSASSSFFRLT